MIVCFRQLVVKVEYVLGQIMGMIYNVKFLEVVGVDEVVIKSVIDK